MADVRTIWPSITALFPDGDPTFISDQQYVADYLLTKEIPALHIDAVPSTPPARVVLIGCDYGVSGEYFRTFFARSRVLWVPMAAFDPRPAAVKYSIDLLLHTDLAKAVAAIRKWKSVLRKLRQPLLIESDRSAVTFRIREGAAYSIGKSDPALSCGFTPLAELLEVDISSTTANGTQESAYAVDGTFWAEGLCVGHTRDLPHDDPHMEHGRELAKRVASAGGVLARIEGTRLVSALCGGKDISQELISCVGDSGAEVVEFSFGTNHDIANLLDWSVNSQLNEGALGVHFGIGYGVTAAHIDFVQPASRITLASES